jgi:hypothetical protein
MTGLLVYGGSIPELAAIAPAVEIVSNVNVVLADGDRANQAG